MKIGELSRRTGVSVRMLRYYEAEGLIEPGRTDAGYRDYSAGDRRTVEQIILLNKAGMTLSETKQFLPCAMESRGDFEPCDELKARLRARIDRLEEQVRSLKASRALLSTMLDAFERSTPAQ